MGKKSRRARARARAKARARAEQSAAGELAKSMPAERISAAELKPEPKAKVAVPSVEPAVSSVQVTRYRYILPELRLIGIISGALLLILVILTFVIG